MHFDVALIGFGEAGMSFASSGGWRDRATAYDCKADSGISYSIGSTKLADYAMAGVIDALDAAEAAASAPIILSLVTADQALEAARSAASGIRTGTLYCDGNSVAPGTKRAAARIIDAAGGRYVDLAILAPVNPARLSVPIILSGPAAEEARTGLRQLGFDDVRVVGETVGRASAIKMIRSVMIKGIEALTSECVIAASRAGVLDEILSSLDASEKPRQWRECADYNLDRMLVHGQRRAAEMEEVARTLEDLGVDPAMTHGTVIRQRALGDLRQVAAPSGLEAKISLIERLSENMGVSAA